jgi:hypothetical protein
MCYAPDEGHSGNQLREVIPEVPCVKRQHVARISAAFAEGNSQQM